MSVLTKLLNKFGVSSYLDLNEEERRTYRSFEEALSGRKLTDEDVATFLATEKEDAIKKLTTTECKTREDIFLKMKLDFIRKIEDFLNSPSVEKKMAEAQISQLLES